MRPIYLGQYCCSRHQSTIYAIIRAATAATAATTAASEPNARRAVAVSNTRPLRYCELMLTDDVVEARTGAELNPGVFTRRLPTSVSNYLTISLPFTYANLKPGSNRSRCHVNMLIKQMRWREREGGGEGNEESVAGYERIRTITRDRQRYPFKIPL